jgi:hypothetical protein
MSRLAPIGLTAPNQDENDNPNNITAMMSPGKFVEGANGVLELLSDSEEEGLNVKPKAPQSPDEPRDGNCPTVRDSFCCATAAANLRNYLEPTALHYGSHQFVGGIEGILSQWFHKDQSA